MDQQMALTRDNSTPFVTIALLEKIAGQTLPEIFRLAAAVRVRRIDAGGAIFHQDEAHPFLYVVLEGVVKLVYLRPDGKEGIKSFIEERQFFASLSALSPQGRTSFSAVALGPCRLEYIPFSVLRDLADGDLAWSRMMRNAVMAFAERKERRERDFLTLDAEERYRMLLADTPGLVARVPQKDLASYLGITPVGLSRIAKRVKGSPLNKDRKRDSF